MEERPSANDKRVLVVDDNEQNRTLARMTLEQEGGYSVSLASNGEEGLRLFESERPDCVLLDVRMPGMDGFEVCQRLRATPGGADVPVVFLTALRDVETFDRAEAVGGNDFLTKPVYPGELVLRVQQVLRMRRLDAEFQAQCDLLRRQRNELFRLQLQKEDLAAFVVHDLKNPVNAIDLEAQVILRDRQLSERSRGAAEQIRARARDLLRLILDLLDTARADQGQLSPSRRPVALPALVGEILEARAEHAREAGVRLRATIDVALVQADPELLRRVLENLVDNALRHAPPGTSLHVAASRAAHEVEMQVSDEGSGVPAGMRESIFARYVHVDEGAMRMSRGLGLTFCKLAVEAHGGRIWAEDGEPGAVFRLSLPQPAEV